MIKVDDTLVFAFTDVLDCGFDPGVDLWVLYCCFFDQRGYDLLVEELDVFFFFF